MKCTSLILLVSCQLSSISLLSASPAVPDHCCCKSSLSSIKTPSALWPHLSAWLGLCEAAGGGSLPLANPASQKLDPGIPQPGPLQPVHSVLRQAHGSPLGSCHMCLPGGGGGCLARGACSAHLQGRPGRQELIRQEPPPTVEGRERYGELVTSRESKP